MGRCPVPHTHTQSFFSLTCTQKYTCCVKALAHTHIHLYLQPREPNRIAHALQPPNPVTQLQPRIHNSWGRGNNRKKSFRSGQFTAQRHSLQLSIDPNKQEASRNTKKSPKSVEIIAASQQWGLCERHNLIRKYLI